MPIAPTRATLLTRRLGELREWHLIASCPCRAFPRFVSLAPLADAHGSLMRLEALLLRLRCERCGRPPRRVEARQGEPFAGRRGVRGVVVLETPGDVQRSRG